MRRVQVLVAAVLLAGCGRQPTDAAALLAAGDRELALASVTATCGAAATYERALAVTRDAAGQATLHARRAEAFATCDPTRVAAELTEAARLAAVAGDLEGALRARVALQAPPASTSDARIAALRAILAEARAAGARRAETLALERLGDELIEAREFNEAITFLTAGLELAKAAADRLDEARIERLLGLGYHQLGDGDHARPHLERALALAGAAHLPRIEADTALDLGWLCYWVLRDRGYLVYFTRAHVGYTQLGLARTSEGIEARIGVTIGRRVIGDIDGALARLNEALADARAIGADAAILDAHEHIAGAYAKAGRSAEARATLEEMAAFAARTGHAHQRTVALITAARLAIKDHLFADAEEKVGQVITQITAEEAAVSDERLRLPFAAAMRNAQMVLLDAISGQGDTVRAFAASERLRSRRLLAALGTGEIVDGAGAQALLDGDTTLVEYAFSETRARAFVVGARSIEAFDLGPAKELESVARAWYQTASAAAAAPGEAEAATRALAARILAPLAARLHGRRLVIIPDQSLQTVAFAALPLPDGPLLIDRFELVQVPSASVLKALRGRHDVRPRPTRELAILADPIFDRGDRRAGGAAPPPATVAMRAAGEAADLARLTWTHAEAQAIAALLPPGEVYVAEGAAATRAVALGPEVAGARIVHFATHTLLDDVDPEKSGLVFTQVDEQGQDLDGFVRLPDLEKSRMAAELVVLSACRTAIGKRFEGEGLVGLTRSLLGAGVPRVVSSLWQVDDRATADLMTAFYRGMFDARLPPAAALRRAMLEARRAGPTSLRRWAGFAVYGDWR